MIVTERLILRALTYDQLVKYIKADNSLEEELDLNETLREISPDLKDAFELTILPNVADPKKNYLYSTLWTIILKDGKKMVGDLCFVGEPNKEGEIEIGYGTYAAFRRKGFMTEAVNGMIKWAENQPEVKSIVAATEKSNIASSTILEKNNFVKVGESQTVFNWKLVIKS
jgi:[ribosomal protein S5]-alanine N-acetyltransferase